VLEILQEAAKARGRTTKAAAASGKACNWIRVYINVIRTDSWELSREIWECSWRRPGCGADGQIAARRALTSFEASLWRHLELHVRILVVPPVSSTNLSCLYSALHEDWRRGKAADSILIHGLSTWVSRAWKNKSASPHTLLRSRSTRTTLRYQLSFISSVNVILWASYASGKTEYIPLISKLHSRRSHRQSWPSSLRSGENRQDCGGIRSRDIGTQAELAKRNVSIVRCEWRESKI